MVTNTPIGDIVTQYEPFDLIISHPNQIKLRMKIGKYHSKVKVRANGVSEAINFQYEPEAGNDTDDDLTSDRETGKYIGEYSDAEDYAGLVLSVSERKVDVTTTSEEEIVYEKLCHLDNEYSQKAKNLFEEYQDVILNVKVKQS